jgi:transcriptional regulator with XRE-family HTH domain
MSLPELSSAIAEKRRSLKVSQLELAQKARVSRATLDALENQRAGEIGFSKLTRILAALGLELKLQDEQSRRPTLDDLRQEDMTEAERHDQNLDRRR